MPRFTLRSTDRRGSPGEAYEESLRILRSNLLVALLNLEHPVVLVTSAHEGEGKSSTTAGLASVMAQAGKRVVAVDLDLRRPHLHKNLGAHNDIGFSNLLLGDHSLDEVLQFLEMDTVTGRYGVYFLSAGTRPESPTEMLGAATTQRLLKTLAEQADIVLLDAPPVLPLADALVIGRHVTGALLVAEARRTSIAALVQAKDVLTRNQTRLLGVVVNKIPAAEISYGYGYVSQESGRAEARRWFNMSADASGLERANGGRSSSEGGRHYPR